MSDRRNVVRLVSASAIEDTVCMSIGDELIEQEGGAEEALAAYPMHSTEIILADLLRASRRGESPRQIEKRLVGLIVTFEESFLS